MNTPTTNGQLPGFPSRPGHLARRQAGAALDNASVGIQPSLSILSFLQGAWRVKSRGSSVFVQDDKGNRSSNFDVIILDISKYVSKSYYEGAYEEGRAPDCASIDGITPDPNVPAIQNPVCQTCPQNAWGSATVSISGRAKACRDHRRIAVVPAGDPLNEAFGGPLMFRVPPTSLARFKQYSDFLKSRGCLNPWEVVTRMSLVGTDVQFEAVEWINDETDQILDSVLTQHNDLIEFALYQAAPTEPEAAPAAAPNQQPAQIPGTPPPSVQRRALAAAPRSAFQAAQPAPAPTQAPAAPTPPVQTAPAPRAVPRNVGTLAAPMQPPQPTQPPAQATQRRRAVAPQAPTKAPDDLESAIGDLLGDLGTGPAN